MANNGEEEQENEVVTYFVDEDGRYYYKPTEQGQNMLVLLPADNANTADTPLKDPMMVGETDADSYQTVTFVPSESSNGEVNYVIVKQEENKPKVNMGIEDDQDESNVYIFEDVEMEDNASEEEPDQPPTKKARVRGPLLTCKFCSYTCNRRYLLLRHMQSHSEERPHKCVVCERDFKTVSSLQNHVNTHNGVKPHGCKHCNSSFTTSGELVRHIRYKHTHEKPHKCTECDYAAVELSKLRRHIRCHTGERPYQCQHCTYASPDTFKLKRHLRTHTDEKPYKCDKCSMCFTQSNSLKAHQLIHNVSEKPVFQCELCPAKCSRMIDLRIHIQKLHTSDTPLECKRCGKSFTDRYSYKVHIKTHKGEKSFKCQLCPYASTKSSHLKTHLLKHIDEKPFSCDLCDQSFRQRQQLNHHHDLYHNPDFIPKPPKEKVYSCHACNRTFANKGNLIRHMAIHDPDSGHQEQALALKLGRQKKVKCIDAETLKKMKIEPHVMAKKSVSPKVLANKRNELVKVSAEKSHELVTVLDHDGQQCVMHEVIQLEDETKQQDTVVLSECNPLEDHEEEEEDEDDDGEDEILQEVKKSMPKSSVKLEEEVNACFGFEEENEEEEELFGNEVVF